MRLIFCPRWMKRMNQGVPAGLLRPDLGDGSRGFEREPAAEERQGEEPDRRDRKGGRTEAKDEEAEDHDEEDDAEDGFSRWRHGVTAAPLSDGEGQGSRQYHDAVVRK